MSEIVHVGCYVLCYILPQLTSSVVLGMDWLHAINPLIDWNAYPLSLECIGEIVYILGTKLDCSCASVEVCALKSVL